MIPRTGLNIRIVGRSDGGAQTVARVIEQSVSAEEYVPAGTVITVSVINYGFED